MCEKQTQQKQFNVFFTPKLPRVEKLLFNSYSIMKTYGPRTSVRLGNILNLAIRRMGADSRGGSKQESLELPRTKKSMWPNINQNRQTKQTIHSKIRTQVGTVDETKAADGWQRHADAERVKVIPLTCRGNTLLDLLPPEMICCQQTETQTEKYKSLLEFKNIF